MPIASPEGLCGDTLARWLGDHLLPLVQKPGRYCGGEWGVTRRDCLPHGGSALLAFPDVYEIGAGHVGVALLKDAIEAHPGMAAERAFCPWPDMEHLMRRHGVELYSIESFLPARLFDVLGITIQHEMSFTNILTLIDLARIPLRQAERAATDAYVVGGGPGTCNPEPMADFFDLFIIGDGEEVFPGVVALLAEGRHRRRPRNEVLRQVADVPGVYVPSLYRVDEREPRGTPVPVDFAPPSISAARVQALRSDYPAPPVPLIASTQDRPAVEIMRGCPRHCRFCQARKYYGPPRLRSPDEIVHQAVEATAATGWNEVSLLSLSTGDYPRLADLAETLNRYLLPRRIGMSLPSLRAESFTEDVCRELARSHQRGLTLAPEAGTERLRAHVGKTLTDDDLLRAVELAYSHGWTNVKLYFMVGLPGETEEDVEAIGRLVRRVVDSARRHGGRRLGVSCAPFVPKPQTEFQREACVAPDIIADRQRRVRSLMPRKIVDYSWRDPRISRWETVFARGDRRLGSVVMDTWRRGARFDEWESSFQADLWSESARSLDLDALTREIHPDQPLPWSHIRFDGEPPRRVALRHQEELPVSALCVGIEGPAPGLHRMRVAYRKDGLRRFLSHLDMARIWHLILRRADAHLAYSTGMVPRPRLAFGPALPLGIPSDGELMEFWTERADPTMLLTHMAAQCPEGIEIISLREVSPGAPSLDSDIAIADYEVRGTGGRPEPDAVPPGVMGLVVAEGMLRFSIHLKTKGAPKPRDLAAHLCGVAGDESLLLSIRRTALWALRDGVRVSPMEDA
ncbi:TIGR03960 family B12-binding radical SAM protein [Candidatus Fermentibacteria bacterium]|nr:TIGR03960 family B12-binding radical SAM protein [Candidatus Fermentibacteria bacterium]